MQKPSLKCIYMRLKMDLSISHFTAEIIIIILIIIVLCIFLCRYYAFGSDDDEEEYYTVLIIDQQNEDEDVYGDLVGLKKPANGMPKMHRDMPSRQHLLVPVNYFVNL